jgi:hypothetical protein
MWKIQVTTVLNNGWEDYENGFNTEDDAFARMMLLEESSDISGFGEAYRVVQEEK